jgi:hypothetical protein
LSYFQTAVIKLKVVPSVRVSPGTHQVPNGHAVMDRRSAPKPATSVGVTVTSGTVRGSATVAPWAKLDSDASKSADSSAEKPANVLGFDDWTSVQSSRSPKKKRAYIEEGQEKPKVAFLKQMLN